jgi:hypothetical protein
VVRRINWSFERREVCRVTSLLVMLERPDVERCRYGRVDEHARGCGLEVGHRQERIRAGLEPDEVGILRRRACVIELDETEPPAAELAEDHRGHEVASAEGVRMVSNVRSDRARIAGEDVDVSGIEPATIGRFYRFRWTAGDDPLAHFGTNDAIVQETFAEEHQLEVDSQLTLRTREAALFGSSSRAYPTRPSSTRCSPR